jgi:Zn-dependent protease with chaperone function
MRLATAVIDVHPPRAGRFRKRLRDMFPAPRAYYGVRDGLYTAGNRTADLAGALKPQKPAFPPPPIALRLIVPGWPQYWSGQRWRAHAFFWSFMLCLLWGLLTLGTTFGSFMLGMAFSVHSAAAVDAVNQSVPCAHGFRAQMARSLFVTLVLALFIYAPIAWMASRFLTLQTLELGIGPFQPGDVVVIADRSRAALPEPGQVVLYRLVSEERIELQAGNNGHGRRLLDPSGTRIDRVLAVAGDRVRWESPNLYINDKPSSLRPLQSMVMPKKLQVSVPAGHVLIFPTTTPRMDAQMSIVVWQTLSVVPIDQVQGRVFMRYQPLSRLAIIR